MSGIVGDNTARASGVIAAAGGGKVLQVGSATKTDTFSTTSVTPILITGLTVTLTPTSASSKFLITSKVSMGNAGSYGNFTDLFTDVGGGGHTILLRGDSSGSRRRCSSFQAINEEAQYDVNLQYLDSPGTTSDVTYAAYGSCSESSHAYVCNMEYDNTNVIHVGVAASTITVMEIDGS
jgi:hypothetical protein